MIKELILLILFIIVSNFVAYKGGAQVSERQIIQQLCERQMYDFCEVFERKQYRLKDNHND